MRRFADEHDIDLAASYAYSDSASDLPMLRAVGHPVAVNPDPELAAVAAEQGWDVMRFEKLGRRLAIAGATLAAAAVGGLARAGSPGGERPGGASASSAAAADSRHAPGAWTRIYPLVDGRRARRPPSRPPVAGGGLRPRARARRAVQHRLRAPREAALHRGGPADDQARHRPSRRAPLHARRLPLDVPGTALDDAPVRRLRHRRGDQRALSLPARPRPDGALDRLRHADPDGLRLRPRPQPRRGRRRGRRDRHARRHARPSSTGSRSAR